MYLWNGLNGCMAVLLILTLLLLLLLLLLLVIGNVRCTQHILFMVIWRYAYGKGPFR